MFDNEQIATQPVFLLFIAFSFFLTLVYFWGRKKNKALSLSVFNDITDVIKPDDQTFTNIGGAIGYHANFFIKKKSPISRVDVTVTFLPRHSLLYFPISKLIKRYDRLFITLYLRHGPSEEGHLIEAKYDGFRRSKITNAHLLNREDVKWGNYKFYLYYKSVKMLDNFMKFMDSNPDPGVIRHIAIVPDQKKCFIFMIPRKEQVAKYLAPVYRWIPSVI